MDSAGQLASGSGNSAVERNTLRTETQELSDEDGRRLINATARVLINENNGRVSNTKSFFESNGVTKYTYGDVN